MVSPRDSAAINAKIATGRVTPDARYPDRVKKAETETPAKEAPIVPEPVEKPKKEKNEKQKTTKKAEKKTTTKKELTLPCDGFVNKYNFLRVSDAILEKLGWPVGKQVDVTLDVQNGALVVNKKA
jgi:hypothetical protein